MTTAEADLQMSLLEERYFVLHRDARTVRTQIEGDGRAVQRRVQLEARLRQDREQMSAILQEIARVEDSLLD
jgi:hypothetical protein